MSLAEYVYTVLLKPKPLKALANWIIRCLIPRAVRYGPVRVVLNPRDPVVSGALTFRVYERSELAFVEKSVRPGMTVLDIGANVGLYAGLTGKMAGPSGRVIAFEPDPESFGFLQATIKENGLSNVQAVQLAASDKEGKSWLFTSSSNRGDSRLYANDLSDGGVEIQQVRLDDYLPHMDVQQVDFIKIDVQGFEGHALRGLEETIRRSPHLIIMSEFWPEGLRSAGSDPKVVLDLLESWGLDLYELESQGNIRPLQDKDGLIRRLAGRKYTNICAIRSEVVTSTS